MIIMRALVATVLLIAVMLVSVVLINANTRPVQSGSAEVTSTKEKGAAPVKGKHQQQKSDVEAALVESLENGEFEEVDSHHVIIERVSEELPKGGKTVVFKKLEQDDESEEKYEEETQEIFVEIDPDKSAEEIILIPGETPSEDDLLFSDSSTTKSESLKTAKDEVRSAKKQETVKETIILKTGTDGPLGYEPESYIILDSEPPVKDKSDEEDDAAESAEIDPIKSSKSVTLERKQRDASGIPETIVMNRVPIVPYIRSEHRSSCPHAFPPSQSGRLVKRGSPPYPGAALASGPLAGAQEPSGFNPYNWDKQNMNQLRFPQCAACKKKSVPVCRTCGRCSECCRHSGCTCGCLHS